MTLQRKETFQDSLRLNPRERDAVLREFPDKQVAKERRQATRYLNDDRSPFLLLIAQPGGTKGKFRITPRNISRSGLAFLHGSFLHVGTTCTMYARTLRGESRCIEGTVVRCNHVRAHIHDVGVRFKEQLQPYLFVSQSAAIDAERESPEETDYRNGVLRQLEDLTRACGTGATMGDIATQLLALAEQVKKDQSNPAAAALARLKQVNEEAARSATSEPAGKAAKQQTGLKGGGRSVWANAPSPPKP